MSRTSRKNRRARRPKLTNLVRVKEAYDQEALARICEMSEEDFGEAFGLEFHPVQQRAPYDYYFFKDNGSAILAVAHLDTVAKSANRAAHFTDTAAGPVVFSRALDDRLGAYIILDLLPKLGITCDILLTTGEEVGQSTAAYFDNGDREYNWIIEFDRGGTDVVMYQYDDEPTRNLVRAAGARPGDGIFSDIAELDFLEAKAFNWGTGYQDYHSARSHAFLNDTFDMVASFMTFHTANEGTYLKHTARPPMPHMPWWVVAEGKDADATVKQTTADAEWWAEQMGDGEFEWDEHDSANWLYGPKKGGVRRLIDTLDTRSDQERYIDGDTGRPAALPPAVPELKIGNGWTATGRSVTFAPPLVEHLTDDQIADLL